MKGANINISKSLLIIFTVFLSCYVIVVNSLSDQVIYVKVSDFDPDLSAFDEEVAGNTWLGTEEE